MSFIIKPINNQYCNQIIDLILPIQQIEFNVPITIQDQPDLLDIEHNYLASGGIFLGAFADNQLIGSIALISTGHNAGAIRKMFVKKEFRGKQLGVAQQLFERLVAHCVDKKIVNLYLGTVNKLEAAQRFYERNGFRKIDKLNLPSYFPVMQADNIFYHLHL